MAKPFQRSAPITGQAARDLLKAFEKPPDPEVVRKRVAKARAYLAAVRAPKPGAEPSRAKLRKLTH
jgi:hypothetical protein